MNVYVFDLGPTKGASRTYYLVPSGSHSLIAAEKFSIGSSTERILTLEVDPNYPGGPRDPNTGATYKALYIRIEDFRSLKPCSNPLVANESKRD